MSQYATVRLYSSIRFFAHIAGDLSRSEWHSSGICAGTAYLSAAERIALRHSAASVIGRTRRISTGYSVLQRLLILHGKSYQARRPRLMGCEHRIRDDTGRGRCEYGSLRDSVVRHR